MAVQPIKPSDVGAEKVRVYPDAVIEAFNELIAENYVNGRSVLHKNKVVERMLSKGLSKGEIYENGWLNVEEVYRGADWNVEYDKPGFDESYEPTFTFTRKS